jgi:hypothetical protein
MALVGLGCLISRSQELALRNWSSLAGNRGYPIGSHPCSISILTARSPGVDTLGNSQRASIRFLALLPVTVSQLAGIGRSGVVWRSPSQRINGSRRKQQVRSTVAGQMT